MHPYAQRFASALFLSTSLLLAACGGGDSQPAFEVGMLVSGQPVAGVHLLPGLQQNIQVRAGQSFEFDSSTPVSWSATFAGTNLPARLDSYYYDGLTLTLDSVTSDHFFAYTSGLIASGYPVTLKLVVTSDLDPSQRSNITVTFIN